MAAFQAEHEQAVLALVEHHEKTDHGMAQVSPSVVEQVRSLTLHLPVAIA
jgi:predicted small metal-binding protein